MIGSAGRTCRPLTLAFGALVLGACQPPDHWQMFEPAIQRDRELPGPPVEAAQLAAEADPDDDTQVPLIDFAADGPIEVGIEQAALLALQNNRDLRVQIFNPAITESFEDIERGIFDPEVFARGEYFEEEGTEISRATSENFATERRETLGEVGIRHNLPTGTTVEGAITTNRAASNRAPEQQVSRVGLSVTQALLRGYGPAVNLARVRQAELETTASLYQLQAFTESLLAQTERTYWLYTLAARRIQIFEQSLELARRQREEVHGRIDVGVLPETERATADAEVAQREQDLIDARARLNTFRLQLLRLINPANGDLFDRELTATSDPSMNAAPLDDLADRVALAIRARPELNEARLRLEQRRLETIVTRNGLLPRLDFFIAYGESGYADELAETFRELDGPTFDFTTGLEFTYPLGNRTAEGLDRAARLSRRQAAAAVQNLEQLVRQDVHIAAVEVERAREQIAASAATRMLREEALRAEEERFRVGDSTSLLVAQAQRDLLESQIAEVDVIVAYRIALIELYRAEGSLLGRRGLLIE